MKAFLAVAGALVALGSASAASAAVAGTGALKLLQSSVTIRFGDHVVLNGVAPRATPVSLAAQTSGKTTQGLLSTEATSIDTFHFDVAPPQRTVFVATSDVGSATIVVNVMPRIGLLRDGTVRISPVAPYVGRTVVLQRLVDGAWVPVMRARFGADGVAHVAKWTPAETLRAFVPALGSGFVSGTSRVFVSGGIVVFP